MSPGSLASLDRRGHLGHREGREALDFLVLKAQEEKLEDLGYLENLVQLAQWGIEDHPDPSGQMDSKAQREHQEGQDYRDSKATPGCREVEECRGIPVWPACLAWKDHQVYQGKRATQGVPGTTAGLAPLA